MPKRCTAKRTRSSKRGATPRPSSHTHGSMPRKPLEPDFDTMIAVLRDSADGLAMLHAIDERHRVGGHGIVTWDDKQAVAYRAAVKKAYFALRGT